jgi:hypothetical protein
LKENPQQRNFNGRSVFSCSNRSAVTALAGVLLIATGSCKSRSFQGRLQSEDSKAPEYIHWVPGAEGQNATWDKEEPNFPYGQSAIEEWSKKIWESPLYLVLKDKDDKWEATKWDTWKVGGLLQGQDDVADVADVLAADALIEYMKTL